MQTSRARMLAFTRVGSLVAWGLGAVLLASPARPDDAGPSAASPVSVEPLESLAQKLTESSKVADPGLAREKARALIEPLKATAADEGSCRALVLLAEAQVRAGLPEAALDTVARARAKQPIPGTPFTCDEVSLLQLWAWASEFDVNAVRRGPGAPLADAEAAWLRSVEAAKIQSHPDMVLIAAGLRNAAELARLRGDHAACAERAARAIAAEPNAERKSALAPTFIDCQAHLTGEGDAADRLSSMLEGQALVDAMDARMRQLKERLDRGHDDPWSLAGVGYYSMAVNSQADTTWSERYLQEAVGLDPHLPDAWFLLGRLHERTGAVAEALDNYRRQVTEHPGQPASRLAANNFAQLLATTSGSSRAQLEEGLKLIDAELARTPEEAAMHDTRGRVLLALGRKAEALAALKRAQELAPDAQLATEIEALDRGAGRRSGG